MSKMRIVQPFFILAISVTARGLEQRNFKIIPPLSRSVDCLPDDAAVPPDCKQYNEFTLIPHPYNCSRFWECEPQQNHCLMECPPVTPTQNLYFNPDLKVCDWPENVNCTMSEGCDCEAWQTCTEEGKCSPNCKENSHCSEDEYCDFTEGGSGDCIKGCRDNVPCGSCGQCLNHVCNEPDCCKDTDCMNNQICVSGSCEFHCSVDTDCSAGQYCDNGNCLEGCSQNTDCTSCDSCINHVCIHPECCSDTVDADCLDASKPVCSVNNTCVECEQNSDCQDNEICLGGSCEFHCSEDTDCSSGQYCENGNCLEGCSQNTDCNSCDSCSNHVCVHPECCADTADTDCVDVGKPICSADNTCVACEDNSDCKLGNICSNGECVPGCTDDDTCASCDSCINNVCTHPECCPDTEYADCRDPLKPICSDDHTCSAGCRREEDCEGFDQICDDTNSNCQFCNQYSHECQPGCNNNDNCDGFHCDVNHQCQSGLLSITLETLRCTGCQGSQGKKDEDGPFIILEGASGTSCNTKQLDNPDRVDFDNGKVAEFKTEDALQSCYKVDLGLGITHGSIHWTASQGEWTPKNQQIVLNWSTGAGSECCCLSRPSINPSNRAAELQNCQPCSSHPGC